MNRATAHHHHHHAPDYNRAFAIGVSLNLVFVAVEAWFGWKADSLALLTDAGHNLGDVLGLLLAWGANALAERTPSLRRTYGYSRATILASLGSAMLLLGAVGAIAWEAVQRIMAPAAPAGLTIVVVAAIGVIINTLTALMFISGNDHDLNIRGAFLHMAADAVVSVGVVISGGLILAFSWHWVDPVISLAIAVVIFLSTWGLLRDSLNLAVDGVPRDIDPGAVRDWLRDRPGVVDLHDLHIWGMSTTDTALTAHLVMDPVPRDDGFIHEVTSGLAERFGIHHATLQVEHVARVDDCHQATHCAE
ncbi:cation transporter [Marinihelvus fidelis]|uniref:Cation transporter n=1 Tax=Marinihelvus fidelis TaxID=2613842 RepID=A0A5N0T8Q4_9GAMM|nr:cation diffusion facilitator family transporter [Marinihelvus fidelis]KAA9131413.1 cation transporter [Marinihelvus fidelis]